ncbi:MAG: hypothetical protein C5B50_00155 [Verrucomicrobia bacterium]|nr:MAG: hypothetical protein C5B50_00155 [Verrucomicrobiota bacterium]
MALAPCSDRLNQRWLIALVIGSLLVVLVMAFQAHHRVHKRMLVGSHTGVNDFQRWMYLTPAFLAGKAEYEGQKVSNPPIILLIFAPFTWLAPDNAQFAWVMCKWVFACGILWCCHRMATNAGIKISPLAAGLALAVWMWPVFIDIAEGQTNLLMLLPLTVGLYLAQSAAPVKQFVAGVLIALAICIKVTPLIFLVYMLWRRRWLVVLGIVLGMGIWLWVVPGLAFGWERNTRWLGEYFQIMIVPYVAHGTVKYYFGQSLPSFITRLFRHVPAFDSNGGPTLYVNVLDLPEAVTNWIVRGVLGALALGGIWWMRRRLVDFRSSRYIVEVGCVGVFMVWASQQSWVPHYVSMVLALTATAMVLSDPQELLAQQRRALRALAASVFLMFMTSDVAKIFGTDGGEYVRTIGVSIWACVLLLAATITSRCGRMPSEAEEDRVPENQQPRSSRGNEAQNLSKTQRI